MLIHDYEYKNDIVLVLNEMISKSAAVKLLATGISRAVVSVGGPGEMAFRGAV